MEKYLLKLANTTASRLVSQALLCEPFLGVLDAVVDLVADQLHLLGLAPLGQRRELARQQHGAGRVGRAGDDQPLEAVLGVQLGDLLDGGLEPRLRAGRDLDHVDAERGEHVAVAGVARPGHRNLVADLERRQEREQEPAAAPGGHDHLVGVDVDAVGPLVVGGDRLAQLEDPDRRRVAERIGALQQPDRPPRAPVREPRWTAARPGGRRRSPWVRCRVWAAASRSMTWNGGTLARLATCQRSAVDVTGPPENRGREPRTAGAPSSPP